MMKICFLIELNLSSYNETPFILAADSHKNFHPQVWRYFLLLLWQALLSTAVFPQHGREELVAALSHASKKYSQPAAAD